MQFEQNYYLANNHVGWQMQKRIYCKARHSKFVLKHWYITYWTAWLHIYIYKYIYIYKKNHNNIDIPLRTSISQNLTDYRVSMNADGVCKTSELGKPILSAHSPQEGFCFNHISTVLNTDKHWIVTQLNTDKYWIVTQSEFGKFIHSTLP